ncbi:MAG: argininosuccinate lyase [Kiritimatiellae bacterium]|nr:argininosuccinate lyase [Kiritimatiellia bacterium]MBP5227032.1 argininosuccinate lyase [Kiritimatiellia bacterium]
MKKRDDQKTIVGKIHPDVLSFTVGKDPVLDLDLAVWDCLGTAAHVTMLADMPVRPAILSADERDRVIAALTDIIREAQAGRFTITDADQDVHLAVERRLTERLGDLGKKIHTGRSRNDQVAVDIRLHAKDQLLHLTDEVAALAESLAAFGKRHEKLPMVGRTHLQPAMPSSVGVWATAYAELLLDDLLMVEAAYIYNDLCPLGSAAGYGVPLPLDRAKTAKLLDFARPHHNVMHASNARGKDEAILLAACAQIMISLSRLAQDLILFSMPEFGYFKLPPDLCTGSSIMPQKYNPDVLELIRAKAALVEGFASTANTLLTGMPGGYNRDLQDTKELYMEGLRVTRTSLRIMNLMVTSLGVNPDRLRAGFIPGVFATDRALEQVAAGVPFREAYQYVRSHLDELEAADPDQAIAAKTHEGTTGGLDFAFYREKIKNVRRWVKERRNHAFRAFAKLLGTAFPLT